MTMKEENHLFQGLRRDNHPIRLESKFLWDALNIRLTNRDDNTFLSITNEKGTKDTGVEFQGQYVGHCVVGEYLIVFTYDVEDRYNYIFKVNNKYEVITLFSNTNDSDKLWTPDNPIEAFGVYENNLVQKVYWVDGVNLPRVINICKEDQDYTHESFDFVQTLNLEETVKVEKLYDEGLFAPGVIQYAFTYYNKYGLETNIFYTTPLNYISPKNRGGNPEERVNNSFKITVDGLDKFEYLRVYSIHRTSINGEPQVKRVTDISLKDKDEYLTSVSYVDNGTTGESVDSSLLLYIGGREIVASTMCSKDGTLFLGNIELKEGKDWLEVKEIIKNEIGPENFSFYDIKYSGQTSGKGKYYNYNISLNNPKFKTGETYRCGILFLYKTGIWSEPIWLCDKIINETYPYINELNYGFGTMSVSIAIKTINKLRKYGYVKARPCVVFPNIIDRTIICQGVLCPTVYNVKMRSSGSPYAMSSWFFRPEVKSEFSNTENIYKGSSIQFLHNRPLLTGGNRGAEVQCTPYDDGVTTINDIDDTKELGNYFFVDSNLVTFHSPDIEFDTSIQNLIFDDTLELRIIGDVLLGSIIGDIDITTSTPTIGETSLGFNLSFIGYLIGEELGTSINGGLISGLFYRDQVVNSNNKASLVDTNFLIYPWHRSGSLNNSSRISQLVTDDTISTVQSAVLLQKKISNLKFFNKFTPVTLTKDNPSFSYRIGEPQLFMSDVVSMKKVWVDYLQKEIIYFGNVDTLITPNSDGYHIYTSGDFAGKISDPASSSDNLTSTDVTSDLYIGNDPVRMKYKSTPHLVFSLKGEQDNDILILPSKNDNIFTEDYEIPTWDSSQGVIDKTSGILELTLIWESNHYGFKPTDAQKDGYAYFSSCEIYDGKEYVTNWFAYVVGEAKIEGGGIEGGTALANISKDTIFVVKGGEEGRCMVKGNTILPTGTTKTTIYTGDTKYFRIKEDTFKINNNRVVSGELEEISEPTIEEADSNKSNTVFKVYQKTLGYEDAFKPFLIMAELRRTNVVNRFGGDDISALRTNLWLPAGEPVSLYVSEEDEESGVEGVEAVFLYGDTWYSRYDCLKTYPFTLEDENQIVEIGSFMCETRVNIDGRYDNNRGQLSNINMSPTNFNLINEVYSQKDNFFNYTILDNDYYKTNKFGNQLTWSLEKYAASDTDVWTDITLANTLDMDGNKGEITAIKLFNQNLLCFQENAISVINYNNRVEIPTSDGVPIEITNGRKVDGYTFLNNSIGCQNKWSIVNSALGIYFIDNNTDTLYSYNGELSPVSDTTGMKWWFKLNHTLNKWHPKDTLNNGLRAYYDSIYGDVYFSPGIDENSEEKNALCFSEKIGNFTSLMSYGGLSAMFNFKDKFYSLKLSDNTTLKLYLNNAGEYNYFYDEYKPWYISFISNENPLYTKVFDTIELRADVYNNDELLQDCPIEYISANNEYQEGKESINHYNARKKFRVWRCNIPRSNNVGKMINHFEQKGGDILRKYGRARMRNPWTLITIGRNTKDSANVTIHDISVKYTL